jgi:hypothetical protein
MEWQDDAPAKYGEKKDGLWIVHAAGGTFWDTDSEWKPQRSDDKTEYADNMVNHWRLNSIYVVSR